MKYDFFRKLFAFSHIKNSLVLHTPKNYRNYCSGTFNIFFILAVFSTVYSIYNWKIEKIIEKIMKLSLIYGRDAPSSNSILQFIEKLIAFFASQSKIEKIIELNKSNNYSIITNNYKKLGESEYNNIAVFILSNASFASCHAKIIIFKH